MAVQQFCLRWNNHLPNFISVFTNLLTNEVLVDVTLAAEGKQLQAHKVVLSACSTYFQTLFTSNPCQHPIVILKDIKFADLKTMVDFMYYGEVNVSQDQLPAILKTAETLKVKGLAEMPEQLSLSKSVSSEKCDSPSPISPSVLRRKRLRKSSTGSGSEQTSEDTAASGSTDLVSHSPIKHESEETILRHEVSTESEQARESSHSFEEEGGAPRNLSEEGESNIRWSSSTEENRASTSSAPIPPQVVEPPQTPTMGSKRGRLLMRQPRIKKESELHGEGDISYEPCRIERQHSEPTPNLLSVPSQHGSYLIKQNSSPHLTSLAAPSNAVQSYPNPSSPAIGHLPSNEPSASKLRVDDARRLEELRQSLGVPSKSIEEPTRPGSIVMSSAQPSCSTLSIVSDREPCPEGRSCHCPVLRSGPALGCNYCWNTIDNHGRILRRKTKYHCPECQTNLCIVPCFQAYHERQCGNTNSSKPSSSNTKEGPSSTGIPTIMKTTSL